MSDYVYLPETEHIVFKKYVHIWRVISDDYRSVNCNEHLHKYEERIGFRVKELMSYVKKKMGCTRLPDGFYLIDHETGVSDYFPEPSWTTRLEKELYIRLYINYKYSDN
jgi:hypothetical protein